MRHGSVFSLQQYNPLLAVIITAACGLLLALPLQAQLNDPTLPPNVATIVANKAAEEDTGWKLSSILISSQRSIAIINGQSVKVGDTLAGARVQSINETIVKLRYRGEIIRLELYPVAVKTVHEE